MRNQKGATWIEVLIVIALGGIITAIAVPTYRHAREVQGQMADFQTYFGVMLPDELNDDQKSVMVSFVAKRLVELSVIANKDYDTLTALFKLPPAENAAEAQSRLDAVTKASAASKKSRDDLRRAKAAALLRDLASE